MVLVSNMPYIGFHYQVGSAASFKDGLLDVLFFADLSKLDLLSYAFQGVGPGKPEDPRIQHYHVRRVDIDTQPAMPIMADGTRLRRGTGTDRSAATRPGSDGRQVGARGAARPRRDSSGADTCSRRMRCACLAIRI